MALHSELPIYKVAYDLLALILQVTRNMPRDVKQQVGTALRDECVQITVLIFRANVAREKAPHLVDVIERLQVAELLLRLSHDLRCRHYVRYVDDFVLLHRSPAQLNAWRAAIEAFLPATLGLQLNHAKTILQPVARGIDFVGQVIAPGRRTLRRRTARMAWRSIAERAADNLFVSANSYFGLFRQASRSHNDRTRLANLVRQRGLSVAMNLTKAYR